MSPVEALQTCPVEKRPRAAPGKKGRDFIPHQGWEDHGGAGGGSLGEEGGGLPTETVSPLNGQR